ncbi:MAG: hypothetical protein ACR2JW_16110 [Thermomicrobiales bacterium]
MFSRVDLTTLPIAELAEIAHAHRVPFHLSTADPLQVIVRPHRDPAMQPLVTAMHARREELAAFLIRHRPPRPATSEREIRYRRDVLLEPDILLSDVAWPELAAMVISLVLGTLEAERAAAEWERGTIGRDAVPTRPIGRTVRL